MLLILIALLLGACTSSPVVLVATAVPLDANFRTYTHPSAVFTVRLPQDWSVRDVSPRDAVRVEFSPPGNTGLPLTFYIINRGEAITAAALLDSLDQYQAVFNDAATFTETSRLAQGDGSWRVTGLRQTAIGTRALNTFIQADGSFLTAIEVDVTNTDPARMAQLRSIINTYRVNTRATIARAELPSAPDTINASAAGTLKFDGVFGFTGSGGTFIIYGQMTNTGLNALEAVRITAVFYDAQGNILGEQPDVAPVEVLYPGGATPFSVRFRSGRPQQAARFEVSAAGRTAEASLTTHIAPDQFLVANDAASYTVDGQLIVRADVVNKTDGIARFVKATVTVYDDSGRVVGVGSTYLTKRDLLPAEASGFEIVFFEVGGAAARYVVSVEGQK